MGKRIPSSQEVKCTVVKAIRDCVETQIKESDTLMGRLRLNQFVIHFLARTIARKLGIAPDDNVAEDILTDDITVDELAEHFQKRIQDEAA